MEMPTDAKATAFDLPGGTIMNGDLATNRPITSWTDETFRDAVTESAAHSWYDNPDALHPWKGETKPAYEPYDGAKKYSFVKSPRYDGHPMQVGPLAQVLTGFAQGHEPTKRWAVKTLETAGAVAKTELSPAILQSTLGRHAARMIRSCVLAETAIKHWTLLAENIGRGDVTSFNPPTFPKGEQRGFGVHEAPRGVLSHWVVIDSGTIKNYQAVVPSTWNAGPRDEQGQLGPYEAALVGNPVANAEQPLELLRTVHSFDPCIACAIHTVDVEGHEIVRVKAL